MIKREHPISVETEIQRYLSQSRREQCDREQAKRDADRAADPEHRKYAKLDDVEFAEAVKRDFGVHIPVTNPKAKQKTYGPD